MDSIVRTWTLLYNNMSRYGNTMQCTPPIGVPSWSAAAGNLGMGGVLVCLDLGRYESSTASRQAHHRLLWLESSMSHFHPSVHLCVRYCFSGCTGLRCVLQRSVLLLWKGCLVQACWLVVLLGKFVVGIFASRPGPATSKLLTKQHCSAVLVMVTSVSERLTSKASEFACISLSERQP
jgi:hypothetical protein